MIFIKYCFVVVSALCVLPSTLGLPIFWFPWNYLLPPTSTSSGGNTATSSSSSSATTLRPIMANIAIGNRQNTSAMIDNGTVINGLTITRGRRDVPLATLPEDLSESGRSESFIQVGNQVIRLPPGNVANLTINIVEGVPYVFGNAPVEVPTAEDSAGMSGILSRIGNFFGGLLGRNPNVN
nr:uncharacterized protein LOC109399696 [Aedes albopictus]